MDNTQAESESLRKVKRDNELEKPSYGEERIEKNK